MTWLRLLFLGNYVHSGSKNELTGDIVVSQFLKFLNINLLNCYIIVSHLQLTL